jgi:hypothetical protein
MSIAAIGCSSFLTSLKRYSRSFGLWLMLLAGPVGARFMVARDNGSGIQIAIGHHLPVMTSAMLGVSLGIVVSTLLLPIGFLYLRSNVTRRQPWQIEEVTAARRVAITIGRFGADVAALFAMLGTLNLAGWLLGWLIVSGPLNLLQISWCLWLIAAPALLGLAAIHQLLGALPPTRRALGDVAFFALWLGSLVSPLAVQGHRSDFRTNMFDFPGFVRPIVGPAPSRGNDFEIGGVTGILPGRIPLDVNRNIASDGYIASRAAWAGFAALLAIGAGLIYRPHSVPRQRRLNGAFSRLLRPSSPPRPQSDALPASTVPAPFANLILGEIRLIGRGRLFLVLATVAAIAGTFGDYRHIGSPGALLLLIFGLSAHAGRSEAAGLLLLTRTAPLEPSTRRIAFLLAGLAWSVLLALPAAAVRLSPQPLILALITAAAAALIAIVLAAISRSSFAARLVLLALWYGYLSG